MSDSDEITIGLDPVTLHDVVADLDAARARVSVLHGDVRSAEDDIAELWARGELTDLLRALGDLDESLEQATALVDRARMAGTPAQQHLARVRLAQVQQRRGEFVDSTLAFTELLHASSQFGAVIEAFTHQAAGVNAFEQGDDADAQAHFERALVLRREYELDLEASESQIALDAVARRAGPS